MGQQGIGINAHAGNGNGTYVPNVSRNQQGHIVVGQQVQSTMTDAEATEYLRNIDNELLSINRSISALQEKKQRAEDLKAAMLIIMNP